MWSKKPYFDPVQKISFIEMGKDYLGRYWVHIKTVQIDLPKRDNSGTIFFNLYINNLPEKLNEVNDIKVNMIEYDIVILNLQKWQKYLRTENSMITNKPKRFIISSHSNMILILH